jgi:ParB/RepB/Spo0J family partition protein
MTRTPAVPEQRIENNMNVKTLPIDCISCNTNRSYGGEGDIKILAEDIKHNGLINPITVKAHLNIDEELNIEKEPKLEYEVTAGRRRLAAVKLLGWKDIPVRILEGDETERAEEIALSENVNRLAMHPLDEAVYFKRLIENGEAIQNIAKRSDRKVPEIYQRIRLLLLEPAVQELFRNGRLSLAAAAMLADLDAGQQALFVEKEVGSHTYDNKIHDWTVKNFIFTLYHDKLYDCVADKACAGCKKRTFYTDKTLFPEADAEQDSCLDHTCYLAKWQKMLEKAIKAAVKENPELAGARILLTNDSDIKKMYGNTVALGPDEYHVKPYSWDTMADEPGKNTSAALYITMGRNLEIKLKYWREKLPKKESADSGFKPVLKLLELPKEEQKAVTEALKDKKLDAYEFTGKVRDRVFGRLMEAKAALSGEDYGQKDIEFFIGKMIFKNKYDGEPDKEQKKIFELFMGYEFDGDIGRLLSNTKWEKICALITAMNMNKYSAVPSVDDFESGKDRKYLDWFPVSHEDVRKIYREEIRALLPKPKAGGKTASGGKGGRKQKSNGKDKA